MHANSDDPPPSPLSLSPQQGPVIKQQVNLCCLILAGPRRARKSSPNVQQSLQTWLWSTLVPPTPLKSPGPRRTSPMVQRQAFLWLCVSCRRYWGAFCGLGSLVHWAPWWQSRHDRVLHCMIAGRGHPWARGSDPGWSRRHLWGTQMHLPELLLRRGTERHMSSQRAQLHEPCIQCIMGTSAQACCGSALQAGVQPEEIIAAALGMLCNLTFDSVENRIAFRTAGGLECLPIHLFFEVT